PFHGDHELAVQHVDDLRDHALVAHRAAFHDRVRLRVHPDVLADAELRLVDQPGRDLEQFRRARDNDLVAVEVRAFLADDVGIEQRRLLDLVELVFVGLQAVLPFLDLVAEGVEVALVLPTEAIHLLLELVSDFFRRLRHLSVALVTRHFWITAGLRTRVVQDATASALETRVCGTRCRLVPSLVRKWHPELKLLLSVLCVGQSEYSTGSESVPNGARTIEHAGTTTAGLVVAKGR